MSAREPLLDGARDPIGGDVGLTIELILAEIGAGAQRTDCRFGPQTLRDAGIAGRLRDAGRQVIEGAVVRDRLTPLHADTDDRVADAALKMQAVEAFVPGLAEVVRHTVMSARFPLILGGDHSCAIGSWSGIADAYRAVGAIGLIWIDAHLDSHTPETSESQAPHGMPLAALLGYGAVSLTDVYGWRGKIAAHHTVVLGARSYEAGEVQLLARLGVRVIGSEEIAQRGLAACLAEAITIVSQGTVGYGVSFDMDAIDPREAPGVGSPAPDGLAASAAVAAMAMVANDPRLLAFELVEYNPRRDDETARTAALCCALLSAAMAPIAPRPSTLKPEAINGGTALQAVRAAV